MNWTEFNSKDQLEAIKKESQEQPVMIFKHSTRCSISAVTLNKLERKWEDTQMAQ